ncbi:MAG: helix-turn-helix transcriptional regulator, partial [Myxococcales bacterium]|nr:helix-turn-helix transcriptional regulator [Myxococcales bacterium]
MSAIVAPEWHLEGILDHQREPVANILSSAERCFQRYGYSETTTRLIAQEAGVSKSLL